MALIVHEVPETTTVMVVPAQKVEVHHHLPMVIQYSKQAAEAAEAELHVHFLVVKANPKDNAEAGEAEVLFQYKEQEEQDNLGVQPNVAEETSGMVLKAELCAEIVNVLQNIPTTQLINVEADKMVM